MKAGFLTQADTDRLHAALQEVVRAPMGFAGTARLVLAQLNQLVDAEFSVMACESPLAGPGFQLVHPMTFPIWEYGEAYETFMSQHPHHRFLKRHFGAPAAQFADIISLRKLERLDLYQHFFKPLGTRHLVGNVFKTDLIDLNALLLPKEGVYRFSQDHGRYTHGMIAFASGKDLSPFSAEQCGLFEAFCRQASFLLQREIAAATRRREVNSQAPTPETSAPPADFPPSMQSVIQDHGLTWAQGRVLRWLSVGKTNAEIAVILGNSERTIQAHVEAILDKLRVENRVAAAYTVWSSRTRS